MYNIQNRMLTHYWIRAIRPAGVEGRGGEEGIFIHTAFYQKTEASRNVFSCFPINWGYTPCLKVLFLHNSSSIKMCVHSGSVPFISIRIRWWERLNFERAEELVPFYEAHALTQSSTSIWVLPPSVLTPLRFEGHNVS